MTFYTEEQKEKLKEVAESWQAKRQPMSESTGAAILDMLGEQQNTLQNIEGILQRMERLMIDYTTRK